MSGMSKHPLFMKNNIPLKTSVIIILCFLIFNFQFLALVLIKFSFGAVILVCCTIILKPKLSLKGTATLTITMFYMKDLNKP